MWIKLLLSLPLFLAADEYNDRRNSAGDDVGQLWELALWCEASEHGDEAVKTFGDILKLDPDHEGAHKKLRHHEYDGQWFETYRALSTYRRAEEERMAKQGLVRYGDDWVAEAEVTFIRMGWLRQEDGTWISAAAAARDTLRTDLTAKGWQQQDLTWIAPDEFESWRAGLWKCGDQWLDTEAADTWHAELGQWWQIPGDRFVAATTIDRESARWVAWWADQTYADLLRAIGMQPKERPQVIALNSLDQYNEFAAGSVAEQRPAAEGSGWSSVHYAFHADSYVELGGGAPEYLGSGVCYWDTQSEDLKPWGQHAVRHAAAHSYIEAVDPSWGAVSDMLAAGIGTPLDTQAFWSEKALPTWFRFGVATYCERYFKDANAAEGADPWWARAWTLENLKNKGGLRDLEEIFAFSIDTADPEGSGRLFSEAGLLVSFVLDGECAPVVAAHAKLKHALKRGDDPEGAARELEQALVKNEKKIRSYAGL